MSSSRISFDFQPINKFDATQKPASKEPSILQMEVPKQDKHIDKRGNSLMEVPKEVPKQDEYIVKRGDTLTEIDRLTIMQ